MQRFLSSFIGRIPPRGVGIGVGVGALATGAALANQARPVSLTDPDMWNPRVNRQRWAPREDPFGIPVGSVFRCEHLKPVPSLGQQAALATKATIRENYFVVRRGIEKYTRIFGAEFGERVSGLGPKDHLLDAGAGQCVAVMDYVKSAGDDGAKVSAVSYFVTSSAKQKINARGVSLFTGRFFEDIENDELKGDFGAMSMIVDVFGILPYSSKPATVLNKYIDLLAEGGRVYIHMAVVGRNVVTCSDGSKLTFKEWLEQNQGIVIEEANMGICMTLKDRSQAHFPPLTLTDVDMESRPPHRKTFQQAM
ncbi:MAG: hypothetical protein VYA34_02595 [Myxococcota bacterium]|nr:hypothetical protein [Myxococcota bacterium]